MKKNKKPKKIDKLRGLSTRKLISMAAVVILVASIGVYTLISSFAASNGIISVKLVDKATGKPIPAGEGYVSISITTPNTLCSNMDGLTDADGQINFSGCYIGVAYNITFITFKGGWYQVAPGSAYNSGSQLSIPAGTQQSFVFISTVPTDSDGDGVPNKTDSCVSTSGPASNKGCPLPAPVTPTTPAPTTPAPTTTTTTPTKPTPASSSSTSSSKKTTPAAPAATAPATVVATSGDTSPPAAPENLIISKIDGNLFLSWDDASDNVGVTGYNIERSTDGKNWKSVATNVTVTFYNDTGTDASNNHYYYRIQAVDKSGNLSEGTLGDIVLTASKAGSSKNKTASPSAKKSSSGLVAGLTVGVVVVLALIAGSFILLRRRMLSSNDPYSYDVGGMTPPNLPTATVMPSNTPLPQQTPPIANQPVYNAGPPAQHTSVSLKEMVLEEMNRHGPNQQGQPPLPPQPPNPPIQPQ